MQESTQNDHVESTVVIFIKKIAKHSPIVIHSVGIIIYSVLFYVGFYYSEKVKGFAGKIIFIVIYVIINFFLFIIFSSIKTDLTDQTAEQPNYQPQSMENIKSVRWTILILFLVYLTILIFNLVCNGYPKLTICNFPTSIPLKTIPSSTLSETPKAPTITVVITPTPKNSFNNCLDRNYWTVFKNSNGIITTYANNSNIQNLSNLGIFTAREDLSVPIGSIKITEDNQNKNIRPSVAICHTNSNSENYEINLEDVDFSSDKNCEKNHICDLQFFFGVGNPFQQTLNRTPQPIFIPDPNFGSFIIFRYFRDNNDTENFMVCQLVSIYETCSFPVYYTNDVNEFKKHKWQIDYYRNGSNSNLKLIEDSKNTLLDSDVSIVNTSKFYFGYSLRGEGTIYGLVSTP